MKIFHLGDLHLGKRVNGFSMLEDQKYILQQILDYAEEERPDGIMIAGDVYDKGIPPIEAVHLLDWFLTELVRKKIFVALVAGNHDSPERLEFGGKLLRENNIYIAGVVREKAVKFIQKDDFGEIHFYLIPFLKPAMVTPFAEEKPKDYTSAMEFILSNTEIDTSKRNILIAHQFVTYGGNVEQCDSETQSIGGLEEMDMAVFDAFDYVALGHLHSPQKVGRDTIRYAGSPLKYSFSEVHQKKSVTVIEMKEKGSVLLKQKPLYPLHDMRMIKGPLEGLLEAAGAESELQQDYIKAVLTDDMEIIDAIGKLRSVYSNVMILEFDNRRMIDRSFSSVPAENFEQISPLHLFQEFYQKQNGIEMSSEEITFLEKMYLEMDSFL